MKNIGKVFGLLLVAAISLSIVVFGYKVYQHKNYEQRLASAQLTIKQQSSKMGDLTKKVNQLFADEQDDLLNPEINTDKISDLKTEINGMRVSADSYQVKKQDLPEEDANFADKQAELLRRVSQAYDKSNLQDQIADLFQTDAVNWQSVNDQAVINLDTKTEKVTELLQKVSEMPEGNWKKLANGYLNLAQDECTQAAPTLDMINQMVVNGKVSENANADTYTQLVNTLYTIKHQGLSEALENKVREVKTQLQAAGRM